MKKVTKEIVKIIYKKRPANAQKYDYGFVLVIGGSELYSGSPALSALAAYRSGADLVHIVAPKRAADIIASFSPDLICYPLPGSHLRKDHLPDLISITESAKIVSRGNMSIVIGGGLGRSQESQETVRNYLSNVSVPVVVDADAIHAIADDIDIIARKPFLITPHGYEFYLLTKKKIDNLSQKEKIEIVKQEAARLKTNILFKGNIDIISDGKEVILNETGSPYLSVGGTGDVLAGIVGSVLAQGHNPLLAAQVAAYINGKAGEIASKEVREGLMATDLIEIIPKILH
jgi:ADP-dependent NAD(P)H-hydrate dehydratase / NAD(P)H-hydrate epimerase